MGDKTLYNSTNIRELPAFVPYFMHNMYSTDIFASFYIRKVKSRKYQGVLEVKSRVKTWQVRGIWSQQLEH